MRIDKLRFTASILLALTCIASAYAQPHKDSAVSAIRSTFKQINSERSLRVISLDEQEFLGETTDNGGELRGYFKGDSLCKMVLEVGISVAMSRWEYYFDKGQVIFIYETDRYYPVDSTTGELNYSKYVLAFEGRYYYADGKLIDTIFKGRKRLLDSNDNSAAAYLKALPEKQDIEKYVRLLKKRANSRS